MLLACVLLSFESRMVSDAMNEQIEHLRQRHLQRRGLL